MQKQELKKSLSDLRKEKHQYLNDTVFWTKKALDAIKKMEGRDFTYEAPASGKPDRIRTISRRSNGDAIERIITRDIYYSAFVSCISSVEDFLAKVVGFLLSYDNELLKGTIPGVSFSNSSSTENMIEERTDRLFHAPPKKQREYFEEVLKIYLDPDIWLKWFELKARRDVIVHNSGILDEKYV